MRALPLGTLLLASLQVPAQWWSDSGMEIDQVGGITCLYVDTVEHKMYCTGILVSGVGQPDQTLRYTVLDEDGWSLSVPIGNYAMAMVRHHDTLFMGGAFTQVDGVPTPYVACRVNGTWQACGQFNGQVRGLRVIDDELYVLGHFTTIDGAPCKGVAKRVGNGWQCIGELNCNACGVGDIAKYQGELVICGTITFTGNPYRHVLRYTGGQWVPVGPQGLYGGMATGNVMAVYQGELYLGGLIHLSAGNAGFALMRWNGSEWNPVGEGVQDSFGGTDEHIMVYDLVVHDGKLFVAGGFSYAGHVPASRVATWDGVQWCSVGGEIEDFPVTDLAFYNDTLYVAVGPAIADGQPIVAVAKFIAPAFVNNCSGHTGLATPTGAGPLQLVQLGAGRFALEGHEGTGTVAFINTLGQVIQQLSVTGDRPFELRGPYHGVCLVRLPDGRTERVFVQR